MGDEGTVVNFVWWCFNRGATQKLGTAVELDLVDRIYECAVVPEMWPRVLQDLAVIAEARGSALMAMNMQSGILNAASSPGLIDFMTMSVTNAVAAPAMFRRTQRLSSANHAGFITEHDVYTDAELEVEPAYRDYIRPLGLGWAAATILELPSHDNLIFTVERDFARGPIERAAVQRLDQLRPHLARSALLSARLQLERARAAADALEAIGLPGLVFGPSGRVMAANGLIQALSRHVRWRAHDQFGLRDLSADTMLRRAIATLEIEDAATVRSFAARDATAGAPMVAHVIPIRRSARDIFMRCAGMLILTPATAPMAPSLKLIESLFDFSPAEARVARALAGGATVAELAAEAGVSSNTVRTQVRGVLHKAGLRRQVDLVALLSGLSLPRGAA